MYYMRLCDVEYSTVFKPTYKKMAVWDEWAYPAHKIIQ